MRSYWLIPAVIACGLGLAVGDRQSGLPTWVRLRAELASSDSRISALVAETEALRVEIRALDDDPFALERAIREDLELAQPGEVVVRFPPNRPHDPQPPR